MAYPEKGAKYAGEDRANKICNLAEGGAVESHIGKVLNDAGAQGAVHVARTMNRISQATGRPYNQGALGVQKHDDMRQAEEVSDAMRPGAKRE